MVETQPLGGRRRFTRAGRLDRPWNRCIRGQACAAGPRYSEPLASVPTAGGDPRPGRRRGRAHLPSEGPDESFGVAVLPGRPPSDPELADVQMVHTQIELPAVDAVPIANQLRDLRIEADGFNNLPRRLTLVGMACDVHMQEPPPLERDYKEHIQQPKRHGRHDPEERRPCSHRRLWICRRRGSVLPENKRSQLVSCSLLDLTTELS